MSILIIIVLCAVAIGAVIAWNIVEVRQWLKDSEVILWARLQIVIGVVMAVLPTLNPVAWLDAALTPAQRWVMALTAIANGVWTEYLRRRRDAGM